MKKLCLSEKEFENLKFKVLKDWHTESNLHIYNKYLIKVFNSPYRLNEKYENLEILDKNRQQLKRDLPEILLPSFHFFLEEKYRGYGIEHLRGMSLNQYLNNRHISFANKKEALIKVGNLLEKLDNLRNENDFYQNFYINDLNSANIMVMPNRSIKLVDIDSLYLQNSTCFPSMYLTLANRTNIKKLNKYKKYENELIPNRESDIFCYIMLTLEFIINKEVKINDLICYDSHLQYLKNRGLDEELIESLQSIYSNSSNINPCHALKKLQKKYTDF